MEFVFCCYHHVISLFFFPFSFLSFLPRPSILSSVPPSPGSSNVGETLPTGQLSTVPWRRAGVKYTNNEAYFDVIEEIDAIIDKSGMGLDGVLCCFVCHIVSFCAVEQCVFYSGLFWLFLVVLLFLVVVMFSWVDVMLCFTYTLVCPDTEH